MLVVLIIEPVMATLLSDICAMSAYWKLITMSKIRNIFTATTSENSGMRQFKKDGSTARVGFPNVLTGKFTPYALNYILGTNIENFSISRPRDGTDICNHSSFKTRTYLVYIVTIISADGLATEGAGSSTNMILTQILPHRRQGPRLNIKTVLSTYGDFHVKDKTAVRTSYL